MCWTGFGETLEIDTMALEKFRIKNFRGKFYLQIAMDWGREGGPLNKDYQDINTTAWPHLFGMYSDVKSYGPFDKESEAQWVLKSTKCKIINYWIRLYTEAEDMANAAGNYKVQNQIIKQVEALEYAMSKY